MANQVTNYKCPACTGPLRFDSATGKLQCDFCGSSYEVAEIEKLYAEKDAQAAGAFRQAEEQAAADGEWASASGSDWGADAEKLRVYSCPSCGAELICDETTSATSCPYCGNNTIVPGQFSGALKPDYVLPFKLDKAAAVAALKKHYGGKKLLPKAFSNENHIEEVKGVYVPFWLYDGSAEVDVRCHGTKVSGYSTARENVTVTNHYDVRRAGTVRFEQRAGGRLEQDARRPHGRHRALRLQGAQALFHGVSARLPRRQVRRFRAGLRRTRGQPLRNERRGADGAGRPRRLHLLHGRKPKRHAPPRQGPLCAACPCGC